MNPSSSDGRQRLRVGDVLGWCLLWMGIAGSVGTHAAGTRPEARSFETRQVFDHVVSLPLGTRPGSALVTGPDGKMYGTNRSSGEGGAGTVYQWRSPGEPQVLFSFEAGSRLEEPGHLNVGRDGFLYGIVKAGVFRLSTGGQVKLWARLAGTSCRYPSSPVIHASDALLYGGTATGGAHDGGCLFSVAADGTLTVVRELGAADGASPAGAMLEASDGYLYGVLSYAGPAECGTIYRMASGGRDFEVLHVFERGDGTGPCTPMSGLVEGADGSLYGTTRIGGAGRRNAGTVFRFRPTAREFTVLHDFSGRPDGAYPTGDLQFGRDGLLYGVTTAGGEYGDGLAFRISTAGAFEALHSFRRSKDQGTPAYGLLERADGVFFGVTYDGGLRHEGTVFRIRAP